MQDDTGNAWITLTTIAFTAPDPNFPEKYEMTPDGTITLTVLTSDALKEGTHVISVEILHTNVAAVADPSPISPITITVVVTDNPCMPNLVVPANNVLDITVLGSKAEDQIVTLPGISNGECNFSVELTTITGLTDAEKALVFV